ncbi:MAG: bifunctional oligoribonuclease/PAP phosphatase NrnA [Melioribacteraceae bacterium]|nr:bifunctional oligoribonuclease/PAP phosphatase NrnA [Melioribacteraceae bacterium]
MQTFNFIYEVIKNNNSFLLTTHVNPDADAIGSEIALYQILKKLNKKISVINHSETPDNLIFLDEDKIIEQYNPDVHDKIINSIDVVFVLDLNRLNRTVSMEKILKSFVKPIICIDHHQDPEDFTPHHYGGIDYSSTGSIIYKMNKELNLVELDKSIALPIYAAVYTDTGGFRYERTTPETHYMAAELLSAGVDPNYVCEMIYEKSKISKIKLLGEILSTLTLIENDQICYMKVTREMFEKTGAKDNDTEGFINYTLSIEGVKIGLLFYEVKHGIKISFRSRDNIYINKLAAEFGGGGHIYAAGARIIDGTLDDYIPKILSAAKKYLKQN